MRKCSCAPTKRSATAKLAIRMDVCRRRSFLLMATAVITSILPKIVHTQLKVFQRIASTITSTHSAAGTVAMASSAGQMAIACLSTLSRAHVHTTGRSIVRVAGEHSSALTRPLAVNEHWMQLFSQQFRHMHHSLSCCASSVLERLQSTVQKRSMGDGGRNA